MAVSAEADGSVPVGGWTCQVNVADVPGGRPLTDVGLVALTLQPSGAESDAVSPEADGRSFGTRTVARAVKGCPGWAVSGTPRVTSTPGRFGMA